MSSLNKCAFIGNLGRDPEIRTMNSGTKVCNLSLAVSERWRDKNSGEMNERTEWVRVVIFDDKLCDVCERYLKKGSKIYLEGSLQTRKYSTEIVLQKFRGTLIMLDGKGGGESGQGSSSAPPPGDLSDQIPFAPHRGL
jgi:single-strand DNA-binding protein